MNRNKRNSRDQESVVQAPHQFRRDRRAFLHLGAVSAAGLAFAQFGGPIPVHADETAAMTGDVALTRLLDGNRRFVAGQPQRPDQSLARRGDVAAGQKPFAFILGCYDSRVSHELVFDQGLGDIFSSRTAGNLIDDAVLGGIEFGVEEFHVPLLVILGHQRCGAVNATVDTLASNATQPGKIGRVVDLITPAVTQAKLLTGDVVDNAVRANVKLGVQTLQASPVLNDLVQDHNKLKIVGAYYSLDTGQVEIIT